jgi:hypothetical protein
MFHCFSFPLSLSLHLPPFLLNLPAFHNFCYPPHVFLHHFNSLFCSLLHIFSDFSISFSYPRGAARVPPSFLIVFSFFTTSFLFIVFRLIIFFPSPYFLFLFLQLFFLSSSSSFRFPSRALHCCALSSEGWQFVMMIVRSGKFELSYTFFVYDLRQFINGAPLVWKGAVRSQLLRGCFYEDLA